MSTTITFRRSPTAVLLPSGSSAIELPPAASSAAAERNVVAEQARQLNELRELLGHLEATISDLQQQQRNSLQEMQQAAVELAIGAASWLVSAAIDRNHFAVDELISQAVRALGPEEQIRIHLHPADRKLLTTLLENGKAADFGNGVRIIENAELKRGTCRAESPALTIVSDWETRLDDIRTTWMESLNEAQVERRADDPDGRGFRRFPDRRETA